MFRLYGYIEELHLLFRSNSEKEIIKEIERYKTFNHKIRCIVVEERNNTLIPIRSVCSDEELKEYIEDYIEEREKKRILKRFLNEIKRY